MLLRYHVAFFFQAWLLTLVSVTSYSLFYAVISIWSAEFNGESNVELIQCLTVFIKNGKGCISLSQFSPGFSSLLLLSHSSLMSILDAILTTFSHEQYSGQYSSVLAMLGTRHTALLVCTCQLAGFLCWLYKFLKMVVCIIEALTVGGDIMWLSCKFSWMVGHMYHSSTKGRGGGIPCL